MHVSITTIIITTTTISYIPYSLSLYVFQTIHIYIRTNIYQNSTSTSIYLHLVELKVKLTLYICGTCLAWSRSPSSSWSILVKWRRLCTGGDGYRKRERDIGSNFVQGTSYYYHCLVHYLSFFLPHRVNSTIIKYR